MRELINAIRRMPGIGSSPDREQLAANPKAISLLSGAFSDIRKQPTGTKEKLSRIAKLIEDLGSQDINLRRASQKEMRDFCLSLHSRLLADKFPAKDADAVFAAGSLRRLEPR